METEKRVYSFREFARGYWSLVRPYRKAMAQAFALTLLIQLAALIEPIVVMSIVNVVIRQGRAAADRIPRLTLIAAVTLFTLTGMKVIQRERGRVVANSIEHDLPVLCQKKLLALPLVYHFRENTGVLVGKMVRGIGRLVDMMWALTYEFLPVYLMAIITIVVVAWIAPVIGAAVFLAAAVYTWILVRSTKQGHPLSEERHDIESRADEAVGQSITNVMTVQAFAQEARENASLADRRTAFRRIVEKEFAIYDRASFLRNAFVSFVRVGVIWFCARDVLGGRMSVGGLVFVTMLTERLFNNLYHLGAVYERFLECAEPVARIQRLLAEPETVRDPESPATFGERLSGGVRIEGVTYAYGSRNRNGTNGHAPKAVLQQVTLHVRAGEMIGIAGESGHGKSTLARLLLRFDDPLLGGIEVDGNDIRRLRLRDYRRQIGYVPQEVEIFDGTVMENIKYGQPEISDADAKWAARIAGAEDFIRGQLEHGYETLVGNRGLKLSGGQRQRIGIARAVLSRPPILIFDEATSSVDPVSIQKIMGAMRELRGSCTMIVISHQLSTIQNADRIVVIEDGRIAEVGTHDQLLVQNGLYHHLVQIQQRMEAAM